MAAAHPDLALAEADLRPAIQAARLAQSDDVNEALEVEEREERRKDREYWAPLKRLLASREFEPASMRRLQIFLNIRE